MIGLILLGAPGSGKGTQAELLSDRLNIPVISTGNILKQAVREGTPLGLEAASYMDAGQLVPDEVIIGIVKERLSDEDCGGGYILDGVPRTIRQAEALEEMGVAITHAVSLEVSDLNIIERLTGRVICSVCGSSYHLRTRRPAVDGICDRCGGALVTRSDDREETVRARLASYHEQTEPLKAFYAEEGKLSLVDGEQGVGETFASVMKILGASE